MRWSSRSSDLDCTTWTACWCLPAYLAKRLQSLLNASARNYGLRSSPIRPCFQRSDVAELATNSRAYSIQSGGPGPPSSTARQRSRILRTVSLGCPTFRVELHCDLPHPIICSSRQFVARLLVLGRLRYLGQLYGTICRLPLRLSIVCQFFVVI